MRYCKHPFVDFWKNDELYQSMITLGRKKEYKLGEEVKNEEIYELLKKAYTNKQ